MFCAYNSIIEFYWTSSYWKREKKSSGVQNCQQFSVFLHFKYLANKPLWKHMPYHYYEKCFDCFFLYVRVHNCPVHFVRVWWWHNARPDTSSNQQYSVEVPNFCVSTVIFHFCYTFQRALFFLVVIHVLIY